MYYNSLYQLPARIFNAMNQGMWVAYPWLGLLTLAIIAGVLFVTRRVFRTHEPRVKAA
jgi:hypothetical protein